MINRKNIFSLILFFCLGSIVAILFYGIGINKYPEYNSRKNRIKRIIEENVTDCLVFGSSHAGAIDTKIIGFKNGKKIISPGADLFEIRYEVASIVPKLTNLDTVLISFSYFTMYYNNGVYLNDKGVRSRKENRIRVYATCPQAMLIDSNIGDYVMGILYPLVTNDHWERVISPQTEKKNKEPGANNKSNQSLSDKIKHLNKHAIERCNRVFRHLVPSMMKNYKGNLFKRNIQNLEKILEILNRHGIRTVLFTPPYWRSYIENTPIEYRDGCAGAILKIQEKYNMEYYDLSSVKDFQNHPNLFSDSDHVDNKNKEAVAKFNKLLRQALSNSQQK